MKTQLSELATNGVLRAAVNTGNRALVQVIDGVPLGVSSALARRLADEIQRWKSALGKLHRSI